jgi:hypothetical protein
MRSEGSSGMSEEDGQRRQPLLSKKLRKLSRISAEFTVRPSPLWKVAYASWQVGPARVREGVLRFYREWARAATERALRPTAPPGRS